MIVATCGSISTKAWEGETENSWLGMGELEILFACLLAPIQKKQKQKTNKTKATPTKNNNKRTHKKRIRGYGWVSGCQLSLDYLTMFTALHNRRDVRQIPWTEVNR